MQLQVLPDNDTSVIRGPVIKKTGWPRGQWSGANPTPECFPFSGVPGANKRDHTKPFPNAVQGEPGRRFLCISEKEYDPKVSFRDGRYYVFDGQNTVEARRACNGGKDLPIRCKVFLSLSKEDEATLFALQTGISTCLTAGERLRANLVARNPDAIHFVRATVDTGVEFAYDGIRASWKIYCIETAYPQYASATKCAEQVVEEEENAVK